MKKRLPVAPAQMTYDELEANARVAWNNAQPGGVAYNTTQSLFEYLTPERAPQVSDDALARLRSFWSRSGDGHAVMMISVIAGEQERRAKAAVARGQETADRALSWSRSATWVAVVAAFAAAVGAAAAIANLFK